MQVLTFDISADWPNAQKFVPVLLVTISLVKVGVVKAGKREVKLMEREKSQDPEPRTF